MPLVISARHEKLPMAFHHDTHEAEVLMNCHVSYGNAHA
jgi:hypothetical protein